MKVQFLPMHKRIEVDAKTNIMQAALECGIDINAMCAGNGTCGKCKVLITKGNQRDFDEIEKTHLTVEERAAGIRLACRVHVCEDCCVIISNEARKKQVKDQFIVNRSKDDIIENVLNQINNYGVVFDIGTTSVEASLYNLDTKERLMQIETGNSQRAFGADVISRISYCNKEEDNLFKLQKMIRECCNNLIDSMLESCHLLKKKDHSKNIKNDEKSNDVIYNVIKSVVMGNTTMSHIFLGKSVDGLARAPFKPAYQGIVHVKNDELIFHMNSKADIIILPGISGHVGSDTMGCIIATDLVNQSGISLLIDIGTNGEMVLSQEGDMICCSTAAGPAFEGASIYQGMRASEGAIKGVRIIDNAIELDVVGEGVPIGICGSGIIDAIAELVQIGIIDETGRILSREEVDSQLKSRIINDNGMQFVLAYNQNGSKIVLTQNDIREVQLAKAAIYAGAIILLKEVGVELKNINCLYLAGAFGSNMKIENAIRIGLLPKVDANKIKLIGNAALAGGVKVLLSEITEMEVTKISENVKHIELAVHEEFTQKYIEAINFNKIE